MSTVKVHHLENSPVIILSRQDISLGAKAIYAILTCVPRMTNKSPFLHEPSNELIRRCCFEDDETINLFLKELVDKGVLNYEKKA
jgi:hypothetical protein